MNSAHNPVKSTLMRIKQANATVAQAHLLVHTFQPMQRKHNPDPLFAWLHEVAVSGNAALVSFANDTR